MYHGAATAAAQPLEYQQRVQAGSTLPSDWAVMGLRVHFLKSPYDAGKFDNMDGTCDFRMVLLGFFRLFNTFLHSRYYLRSDCWIV